MAVEANTGIPREVLQLALDPNLSPVQYDPGSGDTYVKPLGHNGLIQIKDESRSFEVVSDRPPVTILVTESRPDDEIEGRVLDNIHRLISRGDIREAIDSGIIPINQEFPKRFHYSRNFDVCSTTDPTKVWRVTAGLVERQRGGDIWHLPDVTHTLYEARTIRGQDSSTYVELSPDGNRLELKVDREKFGAIEYKKALRKAQKTDMAHAFFHGAGVSLPDIKSVGVMDLPGARFAADQYQAGFLITNRPQIIDPTLLTVIEDTIYSDPGMRRFGPYVKPLASLNYNVLRALRIAHEAEVEGQTGFAHNSLHAGQIGMIPGNMKPSDSPAALIADMECAEWGERAPVAMKVLDVMTFTIDFLEEYYEMIIHKPDGLSRWKELTAFSILGYQNVTDVDEFADRMAEIYRIIEKGVRRGYKPIVGAMKALEMVMQDVWGIRGSDLFNDFHDNVAVPDENGVINGIDLAVANARAAAYGKEAEDESPEPLPAHKSRKRHRSKSRME